MDPKQLILQLGIAGALIYFGSMIAKMLIANWRAAESERITAQRAAEAERTTAIAAGFGGMASAVSALTSSVNTHSAADLQSHIAMTEKIAEIRGQISEALSWQERTPVGGVPAPVPPGPMPALQLPQQHPIVNEPRTSTRPRTPAKGSPTVEGTTYAHHTHPRGKTSG